MYQRTIDFLILHFVSFAFVGKLCFWLAYHSATKTSEVQPVQCLNFIIGIQN